MSKLTADSASTEALIPLMQELAGAYQAFSLYDAEGLRQSGSGLTPSQARVVFTIGGTEGMTCKDIGDITLITKGTLTGVIDRLEEKGLVERWAVEGDGRKTIVALTRRGERVYEKEYPRHIEFLKQKFDRLSARDRKQAIALLAKMRALF
ncbi:MAG: MarR family transcriptional regulator [Xanthomonadales bacterium]|nr:MarR family transcriptional regulator [Gammaproteobacteria bacterium]MBT8051712.1 MarR family transcriptional regulator [Gammaproteobacteria bacterium]MBT8057927.1 MarR family transcriptional regulator [Gammaproteobacteria bacterium]NNJ78502.1 MarR family transcriptional regulator [Xanthomonadales bacterium]NNL05738.1 MarR family transcriptional regulator [Xanthomonadales bacterium]